jgi:plasmid stabilization system protein ParE
MRKIVLSRRASIRLEKLLDYLETEWSVTVKNEFIEKLDKSLSQIQKFPDSSPYSNVIKGLHKYVITRQTSMYYKYDDKAITIIAFFDNRMNPERLSNEIR